MIRILTSLVAFFTVGALSAQQVTERVPKLVVGITIDQLRGDYLEHFKSVLGEKGFKRLLREGLVYKNVNFNLDQPNRASSLATIYTGAYPSTNAITGVQSFNTNQQSLRPIFSDEDYLGNYTQDRFSPKALIGSTIADELKLASRNASDVYSLAINVDAALISGGHAANAAYWIDDATGKWASTTYYKLFHSSVDNDNRGADSYSVTALGSLWQPLKANQGLAFPYTQTQGGFIHQLGNTSNTYSLSKTTPLANENVRSTAINLIKKANLGKREVPDFLGLTFYAGAYANASEYGNEIEDTYVRLDKDIEMLLQAIDEQVGLKNALVFLSSTGYYDSKKLELASDTEAIGGGYFYLDRAQALLNMYLMALYGQNEKWIEGITNNQVFLNRKLIKDKGLNLYDIQSQVADFLSELSGVGETYTFKQLFIDQHSSEQLTRLKNSFYAPKAGDVIFKLLPSWTLKLNENKKEYVQRADAVVSPFILLGAQLQPVQYSQMIEAVDIAPTIAYIMRIRAPSGSIGKVLPEIL